ncbi:unnamed protein product [Clavelina lepadiformis]|uniref:Uncharacterized protein n=1 Tax=Clavelina lepadiformis TaxID=159417 RepID=A0ABP0F1H8_CLALP
MVKQNRPKETPSQGPEPRFCGQKSKKKTCQNLTSYAKQNESSFKNTRLKQMIFFDVTADDVRKMLADLKHRRSKYEKKHCSRMSREKT